MAEIWKDIPDYKGLYQVSNMGRIKSFKSGKEKVLKPQLGNHKYMVVGLYNKGKISTKTIHRIVAEVFIPNPNNKPQIDHINAIRSDNRAENLRWSTVLENVRNPITLNRIRSAVTNTNKMKIGKTFSDSHRANLSKSLRESPKNHGKVGSLCKLSIPVFQYDMDGNFIKEYAGQAEASRETKISQSNIGMACNGIRFSAGGFQWRKYKKQKI